MPPIAHSKTTDIHETNTSNTTKQIIDTTAEEITNYKKTKYSLLMILNNIETQLGMEKFKCEQQNWSNHVDEFVKNYYLISAFSFADKALETFILAKQHLLENPQVDETVRKGWQKEKNAAKETLEKCLDSAKEFIKRYEAYLNDQIKNLEEGKEKEFYKTMLKNFAKIISDHPLSKQHTLPNISKTNRFIHAMSNAHLQTMTDARNITESALTDDAQSVVALKQNR